MLRSLLLLSALLSPLHAETGADAWLRYAALDSAAARAYGSLPATVVTLTATPVAQSAQREVVRGIRGMLGHTLRIETALPKENAIVLGTLADLRQSAPCLLYTSPSPRD